MPLLPEEIGSKAFPRRLWRGYDRREVDAFLQQVAADYSAAIHRIASASAQRPTSYEGFGMEVAAIAQATRQAAQDVQRKAERDAEQVLSEAQQLKRTAREDAERARRDMDEAQRLCVEVDRRQLQLTTLEARMLERVTAIEHQVDELRSTVALLDHVGRLESLAKSLRAEVESRTDWPLGQVDSKPPVS